MPSPTTAHDLITSAMRVVGIISSGAGETPTADEATDALSSLNDLLESMTLENLFVWSSANEVFTTVPGALSRTIGPTGNYVTNRPVRVNGGYTTLQGVDFPIQMIGQGEYDTIALKTMQQPIITQMVYINDFPNGILYMYPTPSDTLPLTLNMDRVLSSVATIATTISMPPGYLNFMKHALGIMLAPDYGVVPSDIVTGIARQTRAALKRANKLRRVAKFDVALQCDAPALWQTGEPP